MPPNGVAELTKCNTGTATLGVIEDEIDSVCYG